MALLVVAYPDLIPADRAWIQAIRQQHDPHYRLIAPHMTLVFPVEAVDAASLVAHVATLTRQVAPIPLVIECATIVKDAFSPLTHVFLVPDAGNAALIKLHDALYSGILAPARRLDVPYIPHITVGASADAQQCKHVADAINRQDRCIHARLASVTILDVLRQRVATVHELALRAHDA